MLSMVLTASSGVSFVASAGTLPPSPDSAAAYDSIVRADHFGQADDLWMMKSFLERFPASSYAPEVTLMMADRYFLTGEYPLAYAAYSRLDRSMFSGETRKRYLYRYAFSMLKTGYYEEARPLFGQLFYDPDYGNASRFYMAYLDYVGGAYDKAYEGFKKVENTSERGLEAEYYINQIEFRRGNYRKVADASSRLLLGDVDYQLRPETMKAAGVSYYKLGEPAKALPLLEEYVDLKRDGADDTAVYALGAILYDQGDYDRAERLFSTLTDGNGDLTQSSWLYLGQIYVSRGDDQAAALAFDRASKMSWDPAVAETAAYNLSVSSATGSRLPFADSAAAMEQFIADHPSSQYSHTLSRYLFNAYYSQRDYIKALEILKGMPVGKETALLRQKVDYQYGIEKLRDGDPEAAISMLADASRGGDPEVAAQASLWLGDAYYASGKYADAAKAYSAAASSADIGANGALARYDLGYAQMKLKKYSEAMKSFDGALKTGGLSPQQQADARLRRADCRYYTGHYSEALKEFRDLAKGSDANAVYARIREADILGREGKVQERIGILQSLADSGETGVWTPTVLQRLGDAYTENGMDGKAAAIYQRLLDSDASDGDKARLYYSLAANADKLCDGGNVLEALEIYKRLEGSYIPAVHSQGILGVMRASDSPQEIVEYSGKAMSLPGITADVTAEAGFRRAVARLSLGGKESAEALATLEEMAKNPDTEWGAEAALALGRHYLQAGQPAKAEKVLQDLVDSGYDDPYQLAMGYILLSDASAALDKAYLARLYLETLRANYPGDEQEVYDMIDSRLKNLKK